MSATIDRDELKAKIDRADEFTLIDALPPQMYRKAHLPGAINIPAADVPAFAPQMIPNKAGEIVVYCASPS